MSDLDAAMRGARPGVSRLRVARTLRGMSQREVEQLAGLPKTSLSHIESGRRPADPATRARLALALDMPVEELFGLSRVAA